MRVTLDIKDTNAEVATKELTLRNKLLKQEVKVLTKQVTQLEKIQEIKTKNAEKVKALQTENKFLVEDTTALKSRVTELTKNLV